MVMDQPRSDSTRPAANDSRIATPAPDTQAPDTVAGPQLGLTAEFGRDTPLMLDCGVGLGPFTLAYQTYGSLNAERSNAILVCHALTGDQYMAGIHPVTGKPGWWSEMVGPGLPLDTDRYFVLCVNVLGGCMGSTGPKSVNPASGEPWALDFPVITVADMVRAQKLLIDHLGIDKLFCVIGGSMGGMQVLEWAARYPEQVRLRGAAGE
jgi:homoserine O-acetyltransferase